VQQRIRNLGRFTNSVEVCRKTKKGRWNFTGGEGEKGRSARVWQRKGESSSGISTMAAQRRIIFQKDGKEGGM